VLSGQWGEVWKQLIHQQLKVRAASLVVLMMFYIVHLQRKTAKQNQQNKKHLWREQKNVLCTLNKKFELMLTRRAKAYSSSDSR